jgi:HAE1 family hydrophobic/amphiphilic exporter-1
MALYFAGLQLSVIALIGLVMLAGIVVNNAIVLIDYINQLRRRGQDLYDALVIAGNRRLRPIFMTTMTTVLGLVPMALGLGSGAEMRRPLAIAVIGGLVFSTVLTLIIIPVIYGIVNRGLRLPARERRVVAREVTA